MKCDANEQRPVLGRSMRLLILALFAGLLLVGCGDGADEQVDADAIGEAEDEANNEMEAVSDEPEAEAMDNDAAVEEEANGSDLYTVVCETDDEGRRTSCAVDQDTFIGWRTLGSSCAVCHGQEAAGSSFAPNLIRRVTEISEERFYEVLAKGIQTAGSAMPGFEDNPNVWPRREGIYGYLKARANGDLPPGRPERLQD